MGNGNGIEPSSDMAEASVVVERVKCFGKHLRCARTRTKVEEHKQLTQMIAKLLHSFETVIAREQMPLGKNRNKQ